MRQVYPHAHFGRRLVTKVRERCYAPNICTTCPSTRTIRPADNSTSFGNQPQAICLHAILSGDATEKHFNTLNDDWNVEERAQTSLDSWGLDGIPLSRPMERLSGGEKNRIFLAGMELHNPTAILLDEPTNHLDMKTKDILKQALLDFDGTLILVSHDRDFLDGLVSKVYEFGNKQVKEHLSGIYEFLEKKKMDSLRELER